MRHVPAAVLAVIAAAAVAAPAAAQDSAQAAPPDIGGMLGPSITLEAAGASVAPALPAPLPGAVAGTEAGTEAGAGAVTAPQPLPASGPEFLNDFGLAPVIDLVTPKVQQRGGAF